MKFDKNRAKKSENSSEKDLKIFLDLKKEHNKELKFIKENKLYYKKKERVFELKRLIIEVDELIFQNKNPR